MKTINFKLSLIFTNDDMKRIHVKENKGETKIIADVHGMSVRSAKRFINNILNVVRMNIQLIVIHGYNHGTAIRDMINNHFENEHVVSKYIDKDNKGVTHSIAAA